MSWIGTWRNQYGSTLRLTSEQHDEIRGFFRTELRDSGFYGHELPVVGVHRGNCLSFTFTGVTPDGDAICSFTGLLRAGKLQTLWHVIADSKPWPHAVLTNADTFERLD